MTARPAAPGAPKSNDMSDISEDDLYAMANVYPDDSGLPMTVWVRPRSNERHGPRIKVCTVPDQTVTMTLPPTIRVIPPGGLPADDRHQSRTG